MRFVISILVLVSVFNENVKCSVVNLPPYQAPPETVIRDFNEVFKSAMPNLDPIEIDLFEINYPGEIYGASVNTSKGSITGLKNSRLLDTQFSKTEPAVTFHILFPFIKVYAEHYELDGHLLYVVPIKGRGIAHFEFHNLQLKGTLYLKKSTKSSSVVIEKFEDGELNIERIVSRTEFDNNIDNIISAFVEDLLAGYINRFSKYMLLTYNETIVQYINDILEKLSKNRLIIAT